MPKAPRSICLKKKINGMRKYNFKWRTAKYVPGILFLRFIIIFHCLQYHINIIYSSKGYTGWGLSKHHKRHFEIHVRNTCLRCSWLVRIVKSVLDMFRFCMQDVTSARRKHQCMLFYAFLCRFLLCNTQLISVMYCYIFSAPHPNFIFPIRLVSWILHLQENT